MGGEACLAVLIGSPLLNEHNSRQVTPNAAGSQDDSDISSIWERKQIGIIKIRHAPYKFISLLFPSALT